MKSKKIFLLLLFCFNGIVFAQNHTKTIDTLKVIATQKDLDPRNNLKKITESGLKENQANYSNNNLIKKQNFLFGSIENELQNAEKLLKIGIDYKEFTTEFNTVVDLKKSATNGIINNTDRFLTYRNLTVTTLMLNEISDRIDNQLKKIGQNHESLSNIQSKLDSLFTAKELYHIPIDSSSKIIYMNRYINLNKDYKSINYRLKNALDSIQKIQILSSKFKFSLQSDLIETEHLRKEELLFFYTKSVDLFSKTEDTKSFWATFAYSFIKESSLLVFYLFNRYNYILFMFLTIIGLHLYLKLLKRKYEKANLYTKFEYSVPIFRNPLSASIVIACTVFQFFLPQPPFVLTGLFWIITGLTLIKLFKNNISNAFLNFWKIIFLLNIFAMFTYTVLLHSVTESWLILGVSVFSVAYGTYTVINRHKWDSKSLIWIVVLMIVLELFAAIGILIGNYNLSKIFMTIGLFNILIAIMLMSTFHLLNEIGQLSEYLKESEGVKKINFKTLEFYKISKGYALLFFIGWIILVNRNSYWYQSFVKPFEDAFIKPRNIGDFNFTFESFFIFLLVIFISAFIAKIVSFLATDKKETLIDSKTNKMGSWLLLVRILIICCGTLLAFSSAGIPMDRFTIIISALGVGIGFGLQTLVNNLVSGIIIAFEKPVNLDDIIEIGGQTGQMKSIGIRSSVITTFDGADVIIPNGDLLNQHMTNWTMGSSKRRYEINIGVAYGTDLKFTKSLIEAILSKHKLVLKNPDPMVLVTEFNDSSIDFAIKYWVPHFNYGNEVKSELNIEIDEVFKANKIVIPFPQQDIHIQNLPEEIEIGKNKKG